MLGRHGDDRGRDPGRHHRGDDHDHDHDSRSNRWRGHRESPPRKSRTVPATTQAPTTLVWKGKENKEGKKKKVSFADPIETELKPAKPTLQDDSIMLIKGNFNYQPPCFSGSPCVDPLDVECSILYNLSVGQHTEVAPSKEYALVEAAADINNNDSSLSPTMPKADKGDAKAAQVLFELVDNLHKMEGDANIALNPQTPSRTPFPLSVLLGPLCKPHYLQ